MAPELPRRVTLAELKKHHDELIELGAKYGVSNIRVFGSVARGTATDQSDLDLLVDAKDQVSLWDLTGFALEVEELLHVSTQVATVASLKERIRDRIWAEAVSL